MKSGLEVLIIQDVSSRVAGASMTVNSGVNKEGKDIYGLAHYCEHMLFLGSKKYSDPTYFVDFITKHNGKFNGYTDFELTGFFFKINSEKFDHGLDIFSRFFIDPSFSAEYVKKEVNSVNSEFERNIQLDSKRKEMVFRDVADQDSLFHRFSTGNTHTLWKYTKNNGIDLRERVLEYYNAHYRPDNMKLVIYGNESIETYKDMVDEKFYDLKKRNDPYDPDALSSWNKLPWEYDQIGRLVLFKTINNHQDLDISFMVEDVFSSLPENPSLYYKVLINYRGKGSLDDLLRSKGLVAGIKSHVRRTHKGFSFFKIRGYITKKGIKHLDQVIHYIFKYLQYVKKKALNKQLYDYVKKIFDLSFFFMNRKKKPLKYLKLMSSAVWKYDKKFYFTLHKILPKYDEEVVKKFGERLVLKNAIILLGNKEFDGLLEKYPNFVEGSKKSNKSNKSNKSIFDIKNILDTKDPFYKTEYGYYKFSEKFVEEIDTKDYSQHLETKNLRLFSNKKKTT
jgi:insulysin